MNSNGVKIPWYLSTWFIIIVFIATFMFSFGIPGAILAIIRFIKIKDKRKKSGILMGITIAIPALLILLVVLIVKDESKADKLIEQGQYAEAQDYLDDKISGSGDYVYYRQYADLYLAQNLPDEAVQILIDYSERKDISAWSSSLSEKLEECCENASTEYKAKANNIIESYNQYISDKKTKELAEKQKEEDKKATNQAEEIISETAVSAMSAKDVVNEYFKALVNADYNTAILYCDSGNDNYEAVKSLLAPQIYSDMALDFAEGDTDAADLLANNESFKSLIDLVNATRFNGDYSINEEKNVTDSEAEYIVCAARINDGEDAISYMLGDQSGVFYEYYYSQDSEKMERLANENIGALYADFFEVSGKELFDGYAKSINKKSSYSDVEYDVHLKKVSGEWRITSSERMAEETDDNYYSEETYSGESDDGKYGVEIYIHYDKSSGLKYSDDAIILVDGEEYGEIECGDSTSLYLELEKGKHKIQLKKDALFRKGKTNTIKIDVKDDMYCSIRAYEGSIAGLKIELDE